jgi:two-component system, sensor histidine kinase
MDKSRLVLSRYSADMASARDVHETVCRDIIEHVSPTRASVWYFNAEYDALKCAFVVDTRQTEISAGAVLLARDFPEYFAAVTQNVYVRSVDAVNDPATKCLSELYFAPLEISSLLDFVILIDKKPVAVLCCEHCSAIREWTRENQEYLHNMAVLLRLSFIVENREGRRQSI